MASALRLGVAPWTPYASRARLKLDTHKAWSYAKSHFTASGSPQDHPAAQALAKMPYPSVQPDYSIFEERTAEYHQNPLEETLSNPVPSWTPVDTVLKEVQAGRWDTAEALRRELAETGVPIPHHRAFENAAIASISSPDVFASWFALIPDKRVHGSLRQFRTIRAVLFTDPPKHMESIKRFVTIAASKGYGHYVCVPAVASVIRHTPPVVATQFLFQLADCMKGRSARMRTKEMFGVAVRTHASSGRLEEAVTLLQAITERGFTVSGFTYTMLIERLTLSGDELRLSTVRALAPTHLPPMPVIPPTVPLAIDPSTATINTRLRALIDTMAPRYHPHKGQNPTPRIPTHDFVVFLHDYTQHHSPSSSSQRQYVGRLKQTIALLRRHAFRAGRTTASSFALAEMLFHHQQHEHIEVIRAFVRAFEVVGVPAEVTALFGEGSPQTHPHQYQKLWPTRKHTALVWNAMVWLKAQEPQSERLVDRLYMQLLQQTQKPRTQPQIQPQRSSDSLDVTEPVPSSQWNPSYAVDEHHFTPFLAAFGRTRGAPGAARIFSDMRSFGLQPPEHHWAIVLRSLAERGDAVAVWTVLDSMEQASSSGESEVVAGVTFPRAGIATHTAVLRGFVKARLVEEAREGARRIHERYGYLKGDGRERTDRALLMLEALEAQVAAEEDNWY